MNIPTLIIYWDNVRSVTLEYLDGSNNEMTLPEAVFSTWMNEVELEDWQRLGRLVAPCLMIRMRLLGKHFHGFSPRPHGRG